MEKILANQQNNSHPTNTENLLRRFMMMLVHKYSNGCSRLGILSGKKKTGERDLGA